MANSQKSRGLSGADLRDREAVRHMDSLKEEIDSPRCAAMDVLTPAELGRILQSSVDPFRVPIALAILTGMRQTEILGLRWSDMAADLGSLRISQIFRRGRFTQPPTRASCRVIKIPADLRAILEKWRMRFPQNEHDLVCPSSAGLPMEASALAREGLIPALRRANVRRVRFEDLRHSFASNLLADGMCIVAVFETLGHANIDVTVTTYAHAIPTPRRTVSEIMSELLNPMANDDEHRAYGGSKTIL